MFCRRLWALPLAAALSLCTQTSATPAAPDPTPDGPNNYGSSVGVHVHRIAESSYEGRDYITAEITIDPAGSTGWHRHDGTAIGVVKQGTLTRYSSDCSISHVDQAGDQITESANDVHTGRNLGPTPVLLELIYIKPAGMPLSQHMPNPGCPFD